MKKVIVTSALPYINGVKHLGNIVGSILPADVFHRCLDLLGVENIYVCGTDEHGTPAEIAAKKENLSVEEYCEKYYEIQKKIYEDWNIDFTFFGRTSSLENKKTTQSIFQRLNKNGYILEKELTIPYCEKCQGFLPDRYIEGECPHCGAEKARGDQCEECGKLLEPVELKDPYCVTCGGKNISFKKEKHLFLDFPRLEDKLKKWIIEKDWPLNTKNFALGWLKDGLKPRCITRNLKWGVSVPLEDYKHLVFYVWFDAPIGYISITREYTDQWKKWWNEADIYHFLGKDNVPFHTIFWPGILMGAECGFLPKHVQGYEYLNWESKKFSTSKQRGLFTDEALLLFPADYWRYYLIRILPERKDSNFEWKDFQDKINNELIANYGNLFYRVTNFIEKRYKTIPEPGELSEKEKKLDAIYKKTLEKIKDDMENVRLREALKEIMYLSGETNRYFQEKQPWASEDANTTLYFSVNLLRTLTNLLHPFIPEIAEQGLKCLNTNKENWADIYDFKLKPGHEVKSKILIDKIEPITQRQGVIDVNKISFDEFQKMDLRVGTIQKVENHPDADKLYVLEIDTGEKKQIIAGIKEFYGKQDLEGKQVIVVNNLEPAKLRGKESQGMMLAAEDEDGNVSLLTTDKKMKNGSKIR